MEDRTVVALGCQKTKKLICGMEVENVVANGPQSFPTPLIVLKDLMNKCICSCRRSNPHSGTPDPEAGTDTPVNMETHNTLSEANRSNSKDVVFTTQIELNDIDCNGTEV